MIKIVYLILAILVIIVVWGLYQKALAYRPGGQNSAYFVTTAATVGTSSAQVIAADTGRSALILCNPSASATIYWTWGQFGAAVANGAGSHPLASNTCFLLDGTKAADAINMIASAASSPATIDTLD